jgi:hypothetical protein
MAHRRAVAEHGPSPIHRKSFNQPTEEDLPLLLAGIQGSRSTERPAVGIEPPRRPKPRA